MRKNHPFPTLDEAVERVRPVLEVREDSREVLESALEVLELRLEAPIRVAVVHEEHVARANVPRRDDLRRSRTRRSSRKIPSGADVTLDEQGSLKNDRRTRVRDAGARTTDASSRSRKATFGSGSSTRALRR